MLYPWPYEKEQPILDQYADNLERLIKNNDFDELTNYYAYISIGFKDKGIDLNDINTLFLVCFSYCAKYNNIKAFKYLYTVFEQEDLKDYTENLIDETINNTLHALIIYKQYEMFRYLEPILINATSFNPNYFSTELLDLSIKYKNYEMFEYALNNYDIGLKETYRHLNYFRFDDNERKKFCQLLSIRYNIEMNAIYKHVNDFRHYDNEHKKALEMLENIEVE